MQNSQPMVQPQYADDEIDLFELWNNLWEQKLLIVGVTFASFLLGVVLLSVLTPIYKSTAHFLPPKNQDIQLINPNIEGIKYTVDEVYKLFITNLQSRSLRLKFFNENNLLEFYANGNAIDSVYEVFDKEFNQSLIVSFPNMQNDASEFATISLEISDDQLSARLLNQYIDLARKKTKKDILDEIAFEIANQVKAMDEQIQAKRELAEQRRMDRIKELQEALSVAKAMGLSAPKIDQAANKLNMEYMRGTKSIEAEIKVLTNRESDDPFIPGLRDHQEKIAYLKSIQIDPELVNVVRLDQEAEVPVKPIKPKKMLIVAVAIVLGGMLGVFIALIRSAIRNRKLRLEQASAQ